MAGHAEKLPTKSEEVPIRSERRGAVEVKRGEEIINIALKFNEHGDYDRTRYNSTSKKCTHTRRKLKSIGNVVELRLSSEVQ